MPASQQIVFDWIAKSSQLVIKKLSRNDCEWADGKRGHQYGPYIPTELRESGFFPPLGNVNRYKLHILEACIQTFWPETGEIKRSNLKHYSNKSTETHFTGVPKELFAKLTPASFLFGGKLRSPIEDIRYWFVTVDSNSDAAELLESMFDLPSNFHHGLFRPDQANSIPKDQTEELIEELELHLRNGTLDQFIKSVSKLPSPLKLAHEAQSAFLEKNGLKSLDPFSMKAPGDAIMEISRDIEYRLYKKFELRHRAAEAIRIITSRGKSLVDSVVRGFQELDANFLSASQHRKSRAGLSFELHITRFLNDGQILFQPQAVVGGRRPDFILPSLNVFQDPTRTHLEAIILSAKTTLRERWKQLHLERFNCQLFLATVDDRISGPSIRDMEKGGICLVVPESLKTSKETEYAAEPNAITFADLFSSEISQKRPHIRKK